MRNFISDEALERLIQQNNDCGGGAPNYSAEFSPPTPRPVLSLSRSILDAEVTLGQITGSDAVTPLAEPAQVTDTISNE